MYQATDTPNFRGWIVGNAGGTLTIKDCYLGGTYGNNADTFTLTDDDTSDYYFLKETAGKYPYIYGSGSAGTVTLSGTQHLWNGVVTP